MKDLIAIKTIALTLAQFSELTEVPPELEWLANITNDKARRAYTIDAGDSCHKRALAWGRHLQGAKMARPCEHIHEPPL